MVKNENIEMTGEVVGAEGNATFKIKLENNHIVRAHVSGRMRKHYIRIITGDKVRVALSPYDLTKGRIIYREK